jgi:dTDP-4-amino-4,6-dideoxygalactose transaminase
MDASFLPFAPPAIDQEEIDEVVDTLTAGWITTGPKTRRFEAAFGAAVEAEASLALNSCTSALHLALKVLEIGPGDEVITTTLTFAATVNVIEHVGATPRLVDVDALTLNIDPQQVEAAVTERTKAIIVVHYAGHPAEMDAIEAIARRYGLAVIEDAAHAFPARFRERKIGAGNNLACFSFYATKNLTTGEGGMLTGPRELVDQARILSLHGMSRDAWRRYEQRGSWRYDIVLPGYKYNMSDLQASLGLRQLRKIERMHQRRKEVAIEYSRAFSDDAALQVPATLPWVDHAWHLYVLRLRPERTTVTREILIEQLKELGIGCSVHFIPVHTHPYYQSKYGWRDDDFPVAFENFLRMLSLPLHPGLGSGDVERVIGAVRTVLRRA